GPGAEGADLDRDQGTPVDRVVRTRHRPPRSRPGPAGDPMVESCLRRRPAILRPPWETAGPVARRVWPPSGRRPDPRPVQRPARGPMNAWAESWGNAA